VDGYAALMKGRERTFGTFTFPSLAICSHALQPETAIAAESNRRLFNDTNYKTQSVTKITIRMYSSPNIVWVIKSRRIRWPGHIASVGKGGVFWGEKT
jgi:hypothetical protein